MRNYFDLIIERDQCAQFIDDIDNVANLPEQLITNLRAVFKYVQKAGLKLFMAKCHFRTKQVDFLRRTLRPNGETPQ